MLIKKLIMINRRRIPYFIFNVIVIPSIGSLITMYMKDWQRTCIDFDNIVK